MATAAHLAESRRAPRDLVSFRAALEGAGGLRGSLLMVDLSPFGFMSRCAAVLRAGELVRLKLPVVGVREARVVWAVGGRVGGEFVDPIAPSGYARLLAAAPHDRPGWNEV